MLETTSLALLLPPPAGAAPMQVQETQTIGSQLLRKFRPAPPKILRGKLDLSFAVLLMRSSYQATDDIDIVAMDQFQRDFFLIRSAEYEAYTQQLGPGLVQQGDLTDPYYFDFISFAQYLTINRILSSNPPAVFTEQQAIDVGPDEPNVFEPRVIRRDPSLKINQLIADHRRRVGLSILNKLDEIFGGDAITALPKAVSAGERASLDEVYRGLDQLVKIFVISGYAYQGQATRDESKFTLTLSSPANLWSGQALQFQKCRLTNDFLQITALPLVERLGHKVLSSKVLYDGNKEVTTLTLG